MRDHHAAIPTPDEIFRRVMLARSVMYRLGDPTPLTPMALGDGAHLLIKREDLGPVHSFKWRGAVVKVAELHEKGVRRVVAASAGNHAQGVALAAAAFGLHATIYMPRSTPKIKQAEVKRFGGDAVEIRLAGDSYDEAAGLAHACAAESDAVVVHAYDDPAVIAGQGVIGDEILQSGCPARRVYLQIGGGGLAAGVASVLRAHDVDIEIVGVEAEGQASMRAAIEAGVPVDIGRIDGFCDGTAVRKAGATTFGLCRGLLDRVVTVSNDEVCAAIERVWEALRVVPEPSGVLGIAAALREQGDGVPSLAILSGSNLDFMTLPKIAQRSHIGRRERRYYAFSLRECPRALVELLDRLGDGCNIVDFQYGKTDDAAAEPVIGFEAGSDDLDQISGRAASAGIECRDVTGQTAVDFRVIPLRPGLFRWPVFATVRFPDRGGALREFMHRVGDVASICYFNFTSTGETEGCAMMGFEFEEPARRDVFLRLLGVCGQPHEILGPDECRFRVAMGQERTGARLTSGASS